MQAAACSAGLESDLAGRPVLAEAAQGTHLQYQSKPEWSGVSCECLHSPWPHPLFWQEPIPPFQLPPLPLLDIIMHYYLFQTLLWSDMYIVCPVLLYVDMLMVKEHVNSQLLNPHSFMQALTSKRVNDDENNLKYSPHLTTIYFYKFTTTNDY